MSVPDEDELWRSIVDNYGDRPELVDEPPAPVAPAPAHPEVEVEADPDAEAETEDRFVPPTPPPVPRPDNKRLVAWIGLFGVPFLLVVCLLTGIRPPALVGYGMVAWFVGGFGYLVLLMPRGPRDPDDDGARL